VGDAGEDVSPNRHTGPVLARLLDSVQDLEPAPPGFGKCGRCPWRRPGSAPICHRCTAGELPDRATPRCPVCDQPLSPDLPCRNAWCLRADRQFSAVWAIGSHAGPVRQALHEFKIDGERRWAPVLARLVIGFLDDHLPWFDDYDLIVAAPGFVGPGARRDWEPMREVIRAAAAEDGGMWPWDTGDPPAIVRTAECGRISARRGTERRAFAESRLRPALAVPEPARVAGQRLLVVDDVLTEGSTLRELARALRQAGAVEVAGLVLARRPWLSELR